MTVLTKKRLKPMMSIDDMIISLKAKNIKFNYISEDEVKNYLMFNKIVTSEGVKKKINKKINYLFYKRIPKNKDYYKNNDLLKSIYYYFDKIISIDYNPKKSGRNFKKRLDYANAICYIICVSKKTLNRFL